MPRVKWYMGHVPENRRVTRDDFKEGFLIYSDDRKNVMHNVMISSPTAETRIFGTCLLILVRYSTASTSAVGRTLTGK